MKTFNPFDISTDLDSFYTHRGNTHRCRLFEVEDKGVKEFTNFILKVQKHKFQTVAGEQTFFKGALELKPNFARDIKKRVFFFTSGHSWGENFLFYILRQLIMKDLGESRCHCQLTDRIMYSLERAVGNFLSEKMVTLKKEVKQKEKEKEETARLAAGLTKQEWAQKKRDAAQRVRDKKKAVKITNNMEKLTKLAAPLRDMREELDRVINVLNSNDLDQVVVGDSYWQVVAKMNKARVSLARCVKVKPSPEKKVKEKTK